MTMATKTSAFDSAEYLDSPEAIEAYLEDALESNDSAIVAHALGVIARAKGALVPRKSSTVPPIVPQSLLGKCDVIF